MSQKSIFQYFSKKGESKNEDVSTKRLKLDESHQSETQLGKTCCIQYNFKFLFLLIFLAFGMKVLH